MQTQMTRAAVPTRAAPPLMYFEMPRYVVAKADSMSPTIKPGDDVWVDTTVGTCDRDGVYRVGFLGLPGSQTFVRIKVCARGVKLIYDNKRYRGDYIPTKRMSQLRVLGRVMLVGRFL